MHSCDHNVDKSNSEERRVLLGHGFRGVWSTVGREAIWNSSEHGSGDGKNVARTIYMTANQKAVITRVKIEASETHH